MRKLSAQVPRVALSVPEAASALSLGVDAFKSSVQPDLKLVRVGRRVLVPLAELERWIDENAEQSMAEQTGR